MAEGSFCTKGNVAGRVGVKDTWFILVKFSPQAICVLCMLTITVYQVIIVFEMTLGILKNGSVKWIGRKKSKQYTHRMLNNIMKFRRGEQTIKWSKPWKCDDLIIPHAVE